ncbi:LysR family transcriptional regulator [Parasphingorhabdus litoris]|uniref:LysR family transcriptional regulator n=1 Tax=Parasphingorhabdus litoris TaxID=394733 RepID=A0ABP3JX43_9SPHN|nr:LysR family transcriptional regulator [Parasphingorhabdus litoris]
MKNWNEIRTALEVARLGTTLGAAESLGIHRATVTRHIDTLEAELGTKLFQRHARGFTSTRMGEQLLRIATSTEEQFGELQRLALGAESEVEGLLTITAIDILVDPLLQLIDCFRDLHPSTNVQLIVSDQTLKLHYGEADIAFRVGPKPNHPDNVVLPMGQLKIGLYAHEKLLSDSAKGFDVLPQVVPDHLAPSTPYFDWVRENSDAAKVALKSNHVATLWQAVERGLGAGPMPNSLSDVRHLEIGEKHDGWAEPIWAITHVDLHRTSRVQAFVGLLKDSALGLSI